MDLYTIFKNEKYSKPFITKKSTEYKNLAKFVYLEKLKEINKEEEIIEYQKNNFNLLKKKVLEIINEYSEYIVIYYMTKPKYLIKHKLGVNKEYINNNLLNNKKYIDFVNEYEEYILTEEFKKYEELEIEKKKYEKNFKKIIKSFKSTIDENIIDKKINNDISKTIKNNELEIEKQIEEEENEIENELNNEIENEKKYEIENLIENIIETKNENKFNIKSKLNDLKIKKEKNLLFKEKYNSYKYNCDKAFNINIDDIKNENDINNLLNYLKICIEDRKYVRDNFIKNPDEKHEYTIKMFERKYKFYENYLLKYKLNII